MVLKPADMGLSLKRILAKDLTNIEHFCKKNGKFTIEQLEHFISETNADLNAEDELGNNAVLDVLACQDIDEERAVEVIHLMIKYGADINKQNNNQESPLVWAIYRGLLSVAKLLLDNGADKNVKVDGTTLQHFAAASFSSVVLELLWLTWKVDYEVLDSHGKTPLMYSAERNEPIHIRWLIEHGVDVFKTDCLGETALFKAVRQQSNSAAWVLLEVEPYKQLRVKNRRDLNALKLAEYLNLSIYRKLKRLARRERHFFYSRLDRWTGNVYRLYPRRWTAFKLKILYIFVQFIVIIQSSVHFFPEDDIVLSVFLLIFMIFGLIGYVWLFYSDPGYVATTVGSHSMKSGSLSQALLTPQHIEEYNRAITCAKKVRVCTTCKTVVPLRSKHCRELDRCVYRYDHYCPFVGNAIGLKNHRFFVLFLSWNVACISIYFYLLYKWLQRQSTVDQFKNIKTNMFELIFLTILPGLVCLALLIFALSQLVNHLYMISRNLTTNEYINYKKYDYLFQDGIYKNVYSGGCYPNCCDFWCKGNTEAEDETL